MAALTVDFLLDASIGRPRYLIRLFETARRRALTLRKEKIDESDYLQAVEELGWQVLEDFDRELSDVVPDAESLLFRLAQLGASTNLDAVLETINDMGLESVKPNVVIDVLIWTGCLGVKNGSKITYISDCGFRRQFVRTLMQKKKSEVIFHPTLASIFGGSE